MISDEKNLKGFPIVFPTGFPINEKKFIPTEPQTNIISDKKNLLGFPITEKKFIPTEPQTKLQQEYNLRELQKKVGTKLFYKILEPNNKNPHKRFHIESQIVYDSYSK